MTGPETVYRPPAWMDALVDRLSGLPGERFSRFLPPPGGGRRSSAVLILLLPDLGPDPAGGGARRDPEDPAATRVVLIERAATMRSHAGQAAFPGGGTEDGDSGAVSTALREAREEVDLDPEGVRVLSELPTLHIPVSGYDVTPVLGWWERPDPAALWARDRDEVARVALPDLATLVDPRHRLVVRHPSGFVGPAWEVEDLLVWGFTAGLLDRLLDLAGLAQPWRRGARERQVG